MSSDTYLQSILDREAVDNSLYSPVRQVQATLEPTIRHWAGTVFASMSPSGSFAKGTANKSGTDIDLFVSLSQNTSNTLREIYESLFSYMSANRYSPKKQNVSINVRVNGYDVDLVPAKRQDHYTQDHSLYRRKADTWTKTNIQSHIDYVIREGRQSPTRILKLWRNQKGLDFPSFYLELVTIKALENAYYQPLSNQVVIVLHYLNTNFSGARFVDPANTNNIVSNDLSDTQKNEIKRAAGTALQSTWLQVVQ